eukprot:8764-Prorocentrum_minimum.AAC.1
MTYSTLRRLYLSTSQTSAQQLTCNSPYYTLNCDTNHKRNNLPNKTTSLTGREAAWRGGGRGGSSCWGRSGAGTAASPPEGPGGGTPAGPPSSRGSSWTRTPSPPSPSPAEAEAEGTTS